MSNKFLGNQGNNINLTNGTSTLFGSTLGALSLNPSQPVKTNSVRQLVSSKLDIADVNNLQSVLDTHIVTPYVGKIKATDFETDDYVSINTQLQNVSAGGLLFGDNISTQTAELVPYKVYESSINGSLKGWFVLDKNNTTYYECAAARYDSTPDTFNYIGTAGLSAANIGEWVYIDFGVPMRCNSYRLRPFVTPFSSPVSWNVCTSETGLPGSWTVVDVVTDVSYTNGVFDSRSIGNVMSRYWGIEITKVSDTSQLFTIAEWSFSNLAINDTTPSLTSTYSSQKTVDLLATKSDTTHNHDGVYAPLNHTHSSFQYATGHLSGGIISINVGDNTKFDITAGTGEILDVNGVKTSVSWGAFTAQSTTYTGILTYVSVNNLGELTYRTAKPTSENFRDEIFLGVLVHTNQININAVNNEQATVQWGTNSLQDMFTAIGFLNTSGNMLSAVGGALRFQKSSGSMFGYGINYENDIKNPHSKTLNAIDTSTTGIFQYRARNGTSSVLTLVDLNPNILDNGSNYGSFPAVTNNYFTVQRVYSFTSNALKVQAGQYEYKSESEAIVGIETEAFITEPSIKENGLLIGYIVVQQGTTNLANAKFLTAGKFQSAGGGAGTGGDILGPVSSADNAICRFDSTSGKLIQNSTITVSDTGQIDKTTASALSLGETTASAVDISKVGTMTTVKGNLIVDGTASITNHVVINNTAITGNVPVRMEDGLDSAPAYSFNNSTNSGLYLSDGTDVAISHAGVNKLTINSTGVSVNGFVDFMQPCGEIYMIDNSTPTTFTDSTSYFPVLGTFTQNTDVVRHINVDTSTGTMQASMVGFRIPYHVGVTLSFSTSTTNDQDIMFAVFKDGSIVPGSKLQLRAALPSIRYTTAIQCMTVLNEGDSIRLRARNSTNTNDITIHDVNFFAMGMSHSLPPEPVYPAISTPSILGFDTIYSSGGVGYSVPTAGQYPYLTTAPSYFTWRAFNQALGGTNSCALNPSAPFSQTFNGVTGGWIRLDITQIVQVSSYRWSTPLDNTEKAIGWRLYSSLDGTTWTLRDTREPFTWNSNGFTGESLTNTGIIPLTPFPCKFIVLLITQGGGAINTSIEEITYA